MKKLCLSLILPLLGVGHLPVSAQIAGIGIEFSDSAYVPILSNICSGEVYALGPYSAFANASPWGTQGQIDIDWGDGTVLNQPITVNDPMGGGFTPNLFNHTYSSGSYVATCIYADQTGKHDTVLWNVTASRNCGLVFHEVSLDQNGDGWGDAILSGALVDFVDSASVLTTYPVLPLNLGQNSAGQPIVGVAGVNIDNGPYQLSLNPGWLAAHGYTNAQPVSHSWSFNSQMYTSPTVADFVVQCDTLPSTGQSDIGIDFFFGWGFRAGDSSSYVQIKVCNYDCMDSVPGDFVFTFDSLLTVVSHNIPGGVISGNTLVAPLCCVRV